MLPSRGALYDLCALDLSPVALERRLTLCGALLSPQPAERMSGSVPGLPPRRCVLHASVWTSSFGLMFPHRASFGRECVFSFLRLYLESFSTQVGPTYLQPGSSQWCVKEVFGAQVFCACNTKLNVPSLYTYVACALCAIEGKCQFYKQYFIFTYSIHTPLDILWHLISGYIVSKCWQLYFDVVISDKLLLSVCVCEVQSVPNSSDFQIQLQPIFSLREHALTDQTHTLMEKLREYGENKRQYLTIMLCFRCCFCAMREQREKDSNTDSSQ